MMLIFIVKFLTVMALCDAMTMKQIKATGKTIRKTCQPKNNVADEKIDPLAKGEFIAEKEVMCYMACVMKMAGTVKNGKLSYDAAIKQADLLLPEEIKEPAKAALTACKKVGMGATQYMMSQNSTISWHQKMDLLMTMRGKKIYCIAETTDATSRSKRRQADSYKDICEAAFHVTKCVYNQNPDIFFFP